MKNTANQLLIVEDSAIVAKILLHIVKQELDFNILILSESLKMRVLILISYLSKTNYLLPSLVSSMPQIPFFNIPPPQFLNLAQKWR